jgi:SH3-like domain-containing protein
MRHAIAAVTSVLLAASPIAAVAEPATVRVFEAPAREAPDPAARVVHVFVEGAAVSVSEVAEQGWRRVRLPDGSSAWLPEEALALGAGPVPAPAAAGLTPAAPRRHPRRSLTCAPAST